MEYQPAWFVRSIVVSLGFLPSLAACGNEDVNSDAIRTRGIFVDALAVAPGDATTIVRVHLTVGGDDGTDVNLVPPDDLIAEVDELTTPFERTGDGRYEAILNGDASTEITIRLERGADDASAAATALLPEPYAMQLETDAGAGIRRDREVAALWQPAGAASSDLLWSIEGDCVWSESGVTPDDGALTLSGDDVRVRGTRAGDECEVTLTLDRSNDGNVDAVFVPGSSFRAVQRRAVRFVSTPAPGETASPDAGE